MCRSAGGRELYELDALNVCIHQYLILANKGYELGLAGNYVHQSRED